MNIDNQIERNPELDEVGENSPTVDRLYDLCVMLELELIIRDRNDGHELISMK